MDKRRGDSQVIWDHLARSALARLLGRLVYQELQEALERFGYSQCMSMNNGDGTFLAVTEEGSDETYRS